MQFYLIFAKKQPKHLAIEKDLTSMTNYEKTTSEYLIA